jgi:hypothetical protein
MRSRLKQDERILLINLRTEGYKLGVEYLCVMTTNGLGDPNEYRFACAIARSAFPDAESWKEAAGRTVRFYVDSIGKSEAHDGLLDEVLRTGPHASLLVFVSTHTRGDELLAHVGGMVYPTGIDSYSK